MKKLDDNVFSHKNRLSQAIILSVQLVFVIFKKDSIFSKLYEEYRREDQSYFFTSRTCKSRRKDIYK